MTRPRQIFINRVFWPATEATGQLLADLTAELVDAGEDVIVVTASPGPPTMPTPRGGSVAIHRLSSRQSESRGIGTKALNYVRFLSAIRSCIPQLVRPGDLVVAQTDPPMLGPAIGNLVRQCGARMWHWNQDLYPEVAVALAPWGPASKLLGLLKGVRNREWRRSEGVIAIGTDMAERVVANGVPSDRVHVIANWAPQGLEFSEAADQRRHWQISSDTLTLVYSGNLGRVHALAPLLPIAQALREEPHFQMLVVGNGAQRAGLESTAHESDLKQLRFLAPVARSELGRVLGAADVHLVTLRDDCTGLVWPSKFYGIVAAGRPILFIGPAEAEIAQIIVRERLGAVFAASDLEGPVAFIRQLLASPETLAALQARVREFAQEVSGLKGAVVAWQALAERPPSTKDNTSFN